MSEPLRFEEPEPQVGFEADLHVVPDIDESTARPDPDGVAARVGDLYMRHSAQLSTFAYELSPDDPDLAEDAIQEAFCAVAATPSPDDADAGSWLFGAVEQYVQGPSAGTDASPEVPSGLLSPTASPGGTASAETAFFRAELAQVIAGAVSARTMQIIETYVAEGNSLNRAAVLLDLSANGVKSTTSRGMDRIRAAVGSFLGQPVGPEASKWLPAAASEPTPPPAPVTTSKPAPKPVIRLRPTPVRMTHTRLPFTRPDAD